MRRLIIKENPRDTNNDPALFHTHIELDDGSVQRLYLAGFSYFGEVGGHRHIPPAADKVPVLYPDRKTPSWESVIKPDSENAVRATYAQWLALLAERKVNLVRVWVFDPNEADSYPFFHTFNSEQYDLEKPSERYLRRLVRFIDLARAHGIIVHITLASDQMMRPEAWSRTPFHPAHALPITGTEHFTENGFQSFLGITGSTAAAQKRRTIEYDMVKSIVTAVKPYWNVMFELMNEAGLNGSAAALQSWHLEVATWLDDLLKDDRGRRTHLITIAPIPQNLLGIVAKLGSTGRNLFDIVSLHGNSWGGGDGRPDGTATPPLIGAIKAETLKSVRKLYADLPNRPFAIICDSDAFPWAQKNPTLYARSAIEMQLNYAHRWHEDFLTQREASLQLTDLAAAIPENRSFADGGPRPSVITPITFEESAVAGRWTPRPGVTATDIGVFRRDSVWVTSNTPTQGGFTIHRWNGNAWSAVDGGGVRISVGPNGLPWMVNDAGQIFRRTASAWTPVPGSARDIGVGADGSVWIIGTTPSFGGFEILRRVGNAWVRVAGGAVRIAVNPVGEPWVVNDAGTVFARDGNEWIPTPGTARDVGVGQDDTCWIIGTNAVAGGSSVSYWLGAAWRTIDGGGTSIAVDHDGLPWITNSVFTVYQRTAPE